MKIREIDVGITLDKNELCRKLRVNNLEKFYVFVPYNQPQLIGIGVVFFS